MPLQDEKILHKFNNSLKSADESGWKFWRQNEVKEGFRFYYGLEQWSDDNKRKLENRGLKPVIFNRTGPFIKAVQGAIIKARGEVRFYPTDGADIDDEESVNKNKYLADLANQGSKWGRSQADAEYHENIALKDMLISGLGCIEQYIDYVDNPDGEPRYKRVSPLELLWDQTASAVNLSDAKWVIRAKHIAVDEFNELFPNQEINLDFNETERYFDAGFNKNNNKNTIMVFEYQWYKYENYCRVENPLKQDDGFSSIILTSPTLLAELNNRNLNFDDDIWSIDLEDYQSISQVFEGIYQFKSQKTKRKIYYRSFIAGNKVLDKSKSPQQGGFSYKFMMAYFDEDKNCPYGFMRMLKDPQKIANASFMHLFHATLCAPRPAVRAERSVTDDPDTFESQITNRQSVQWVEDGTLGKVIDLHPPAIPTGFESPLNIAAQSMRDVTGINIETLGAGEGDKAGILEKQREERALTNFTDVIDNYRFYMKESAITLLKMLRELSENVNGRMILAIADGKAEKLKLLSDDLAADYRVDVDTAPVSVNQKQENAKHILELMQSGMVPVEYQSSFLKLFIENSGLSQDIVDLADNAAKDQQKLTEADAEIAEMQKQIHDMQMKLQQAEALRIEAEAERIRVDSLVKQVDILQKEANIEKTIADTEKLQVETEKKELELLS